MYKERSEESNLDRKLKRMKRRNFVAKNNRHRAKKHASLKDYNRKSKYPEELFYGSSQE